MKKLFTLLTMLVVGIGSMWATLPAAGAYPVEGKTYYLFANKYNSTDRYYLYWDNTNSALKHATANNKENNDYYKWTVTISEGLYTITNVGTGTSLKWNSGLTLGADGLQFDLSKDVNYTACVSLYATIPDGGRWLCVKNDTETFANGYKYSTFGNYSDYSINFVFEEVLSAHSLTDGMYYTIYCDNDSKQYLYDNAGTLAQTSSAPNSDFKYVWQCIVNESYYNFRNLQTGKYLSHKAISSTANNFNIETTDVYHDGCVKLKTGTNYMGFTKDGDPDQATHARFPKITTDFSFDFRFDEVDLSSWCTGDLLGGSMSGSNNWTNTWTSGTTPQFTLTATNNDIDNKNDRTKGGLDIRSGNTTAGYDTYTITAPTGYLITGYKIVGYALNGDQTVTPSKGGDATVFTTAGNSIYVSGLRQGKASFKLSGANDGLFIRALQVSLTPMASSITSLPTANDKAYVIYNARAVWNFVDNATSMTTVTLPNTDLDNAQQQIALIKKNDNYYLFSINAKKFLTANNTLTGTPTDNEQISITSTGDATYPWFFSFKNVSGKNINVNGDGVVLIDNWNTQDDGNRNAIIEVGDFDPSEAELDDIAFTITDQNGATYNGSYKTIWNGEKTDAPAIPGAYGATFSNKVFSDEGGYSLTAVIDFGFRVSSKGVENPTAIQSALGESLWYAKDGKVIADNKANTTVYDVKADYYRWYICPILDNGEFYFALYNVGARKYIPNNPSTSSSTATTLTDVQTNVGGFQFAHYKQGNGFYDKSSSKFLTINTSGTAQNIWLWTAGATATHMGSVMSFPELTIVSVSETFDALKSATKFDILEGSTVMGPSEFAAPASINAAIDAANALVDPDTDAKIAFIESANGTMIQNYLDQVATYGALANIQITMSKEYGTLILPCPSTRIDGLDIYSCSGRENNTLTLTPVAGNYNQNVPYIIHATEGSKYTIIGWDKGSTDTHTEGWLTGALNSTTDIPNGSYMLATNKTTGVQAFYKVSGDGVKCAINKCYLTVDVGTQARTLYLDIDGEITAIEEVFGDETEQGAIYNLAGQRLTKAQKGINIINGKKVIK